MSQSFFSNVHAQPNVETVLLMSGLTGQMIGHFNFAICKTVAKALDTHTHTHTLS